MQISQSVLLRFACFISVYISSAESARICVFSIVGFMNYRSGYDALVESLIDKGHEVTVFSTLPLAVDKQYESKVRYLSPKSIQNHLESFFNHVSPLAWRYKGKPHVLWDMLPILTLDSCHLLLKDPETQSWIRTAKQYDLFIVDSAWNECGIALSHVFKAKLILFSVHSNLLSWNLEAFGAASELSWVPDVQYAAGSTNILPVAIAEDSILVHLLKKAQSIMRSMRWYIYRNSFTFYQVRKFVRQQLKLQDFPSVLELEQNASVVLVNSHFSEEYARSLPPVFVPIGGLHIRETKNSELTKTFANFLGNSSTGFILANIGCSEDLRKNLLEDTRLQILSAIQKTSEAMKIVWLENSSKKPLLSSSKDILVVEGCARGMSNLLAHPKIKGLISLGDLLDVQEAIHYGVPSILIPVAFEQDANAERIHRLGRGIRLEIVNLQKDSLLEAIQKILHEKTFRANVKAASLMTRDRPTTPMNTALWWIDYTLRTSDVSLLKPLGIHQNWFSRRSLDILLVGLAWVGILVVLLVALCNFYGRKENGSIAKSKKIR